MAEVDPIPALSLPKTNTYESPEKTTPDGISGIPDRISKAPKNVVLAILQENTRHEKVSQDFIKTTGFEIIEDQRRVSASREEQMQALRKKTMKMQAADTWSAISDMASYLTSATNIFLAIDYFTAGGTLAGSFLLASAGIGLGNQCIDLLGGWDALATHFIEGKENQKWASDLYKTTANYISLGAFLVSCGYAYGSNAFQQFTNRAAAALPLAGSLSTNATAAVSHVYKYQANTVEMGFQTLKDEEIMAYASTIAKSSEIDETTQARDAIHQRMRNIVLTQTNMDQ